MGVVMESSGVSLGCLTVNETIIPGTVGCYKVNNIFHTGKSKFQKIHVVDLQSFGPTLMLDEKMQSTTTDEFIYHESLVYPAMLAHPNPKKVLILGGGEGATSREVLRFKSVERCVMVDIDEVVVETSKQFLTSYHKGAWENNRLEVVIGCAKEFLENTEEKWDVIVGDLADPIRGNPCYMLYTVEFYNMMKTKMAPGGIFVTQSGPCGYYSMDEVCVPVHNTLKKVFKHASVYHTHCPAFFDHYGFNLASDVVDARDVLINGDVDKLIEERVDATHETGADASAVGSTAAQFFDGETLKSSFVHPKWMKKKLVENQNFICDAAPSFLT